VLETPFSSLDVSLKRELGDLINNIFSTSRITSGNKKLREYNLFRGSPTFGLPESPLLCVRVKEVIEDSFLLSELLLSANSG
jgi:hypothetical protein